MTTNNNNNSNGFNLGEALPIIVGLAIALNILFASCGEVEVIEPVNPNTPTPADTVQAY